MVRFAAEDATDVLEFVVGQTQRTVQFHYAETMESKRFKMKSVDKSELAELLASTPQRGRTSRGALLLEEFLATGEMATRVQFESTKERNAVALSVSNAAKRAGQEIWVRKLGGGTGTELLLVNLAKADAQTRKAYENRPRVGRRPGS